MNVKLLYWRKWEIGETCTKKNKSEKLRNIKACFKNENEVSYLLK